MDTFDSPYTSHQNNEDCFSASELAYQTAYEQPFSIQPQLLSNCEQRCLEEQKKCVQAGGSQIACYDRLQTCLRGCK